MTGGLCLVEMTEGAPLGATIVHQNRGPESPLLDNILLLSYLALRTL